MDLLQVPSYYSNLAAVIQVKWKAWEILWA